MIRSWLGRVATGFAMIVLGVFWTATFVHSRRVASPEPVRRAPLGHPLASAGGPPREAQPGKNPDPIPATATTPATPPLPTTQKRRSTALRWSGRAVLAAVAIVWALTLRPQSLGGPAMYMIVRGDSMEPTHYYGDLLLILAQPTYGAGDVVAYRVPEGEIGAAKLVVHRIREVAPDGFILRGDNNPNDDPWHPGSDLVAGRVVFAVPKLGQIVSMVAQPTTAGALATTVMVMYLLARNGKAAQPGRPDRGRAGSVGPQVSAA